MGKNPLAVATTPTASLLEILARPQCHRTPHRFMIYASNASLFIATTPPFDFLSSFYFYRPGVCWCAIDWNWIDCTVTCSNFGLCCM
ncbi:hypothetical protein BDN72DRAFT_377609 [Pluteus cervinus]|uniref:Uncharacterized protein n=1 Tax=Pluteus cervinus TaxID=181527 RepID=A0ACD3ACS9_9AGAR|nr:hypothetical protein BDN72DRAFT_377609 [Pluteus cervinus]